MLFNFFFGSYRLHVLLVFRARLRALYLFYCASACVYLFSYASTCVRLQGTILIAVNPLQPIPDPSADEYVDRPLNPDTPHPYAIAEVRVELHHMSAVTARRGVLILLVVRFLCFVVGIFRGTLSMLLGLVIFRGAFSMMRVRSTFSVIGGHVYTYSWADACYTAVADALSFLRLMT